MYGLAATQCAIEKFFKTFLGDRKTNTVLQQLDRLIQSEIATMLSVLLHHQCVTEGVYPSLMGC